MKKITFNEETHRHEIDGVPFHGHFNEWSLEYIPNTYLKESQYSGNEWRKGGYVKIYLNGDCVLKEFCRTEDMAIVLLSKGLHELKCHFEVMGIHLENWKEEMIGQRVYHAGVPSIIERYCGDGEIMLRTEDGKPYRIYGFVEEERKHDPHFDDEWKDRDRVHITDTRISWTRT